MRCRVATLLVILVLSSVAPLRAADLAARDAVVEYLKKHVIDRHFDRAETRQVFENGTLESLARTSVSYQNLTTTKDGLSFDTIWTWKQSLWKLDAQGQRTGEARNEDRVGCSRTVLTQRKSTGALIGISYSLTEGGYEEWVRVDSVSGGELKLTEGIILYSDLFSGAPGESWKPGSYTIERTFSAQDGLPATMQTVDTGYDVDPKTLAKTQSKEILKDLYTEVVRK